MRRREFIAGLGGAAAWPLVARAQQPERVASVAGVSTMTVEQVRGMLLWSAIINYGFLILWTGLYLLARGLLNRVAHWWRLTPEQFDAFQFGGILLYKMGIWMFFIIPCIALYIIH